MNDILSRLKNFIPTKTVVKREKVLVNAKGTSGTEIYAGYFDEEYLTKIKGLQGAKLFDEMRRGDSQIAMLLSVIKNPIKSANWDIQAADDSDLAKEIAAFVRHALFNDIRNPKTGKRKTFREFIEEALTYVEFGHSVFEVVHRYVRGHPVYGDYIGLRDLGFRSQKTIEQWGVRKDGSLDFVRQSVNGDIDVDVPMAGEHLLVFSLNKEGDNYEGISMIRPCYGNWFRKNNYLKFMAIGMEKASIGVPAVEMSAEFIGQSDYDDQYEKLKTLIESFAANETNGFILPAGVKMIDYKISFDAEKVQRAIDSEDVKMTKRFLANFMEMGIEGAGGSYSLGTDLSDIFLGGIEYIAEDICERTNMNVIETLVRAKYGEQEIYPKLVCEGINDKAGKELADIVTGLDSSGLIQKSDKLHSFLHNTYGLPEYDPEKGMPEKEDEPDDELPPSNPPTPQKDETDEDDADDDSVDVEVEDDPESAELSEVPQNNEPNIDVESLIANALGEVSTKYPRGTGLKSVQTAHKLSDKYARGEKTVLSDKLISGEAFSREELIALACVDMISESYRPEHKLDDGGCDHLTLTYALHGGDNAVKWARNALEKIDAHIDAAILADPKIAGLRPSVFIDRASKDMQIEMRNRLTERSDEMLARIDKIIRADGSDAEKTSKALDVSMPRAKQYKDFMRDSLGETAQKTLKATLEEVGKPDMKMSDQDFKDLPKRTRDRIKKEIELVARYQDADLEKMVYFAVNDELAKKTPAAKIIENIKKQRTKYMSGGLIFTQATNLLSKVVNSVRNDVYQVPEVMNDIESFIFVNHNPKSAICQNLVGRVFSKEEYEASDNLPPLHHNCKSVIQAQTKGKAGNKPIDPKGLIPSGTDEELEKILKSKTL